jgi:hypothetical protein
MKKEIGGTFMLQKYKLRQSWILFVLILIGSLMAGCGGNSGHWNPPNPDGTLPTVTFTDPIQGTAGVAVNRMITATFSEAMTPATIDNATFTLTGPGAASVPGSVAYLGVTAVFSPFASLADNTLYTARISSSAKDATGNSMAAPYAWSFTTGSGIDNSAPTVTLTDPANAATGVPLNKKIAATFSEAMAPLTILDTTFTLKRPDNTVVAGAVTLVGRVATFSPAAPLAANTLYTATVNTAARDLAGNALSVDKVWTFRTGSASDTTRPAVTITVPDNAATGVAINTRVSATFSEGMDPLTIVNPTFMVKRPDNTVVTGTVGYAGLTGTFIPLDNLAPGTTYTAVVTTGAKDLAGNTLPADYVWRFSTGVVSDNTAPRVTLVNPADLADNVALNASVNVTFSEPMDPLTINTSSFTLQPFGPPAGAILLGTVGYDLPGRIATFTPTAALLPGTRYTATVNTGSADLAGNALAVDNVWTFTTGTGLAPGAVALGSAAPFGTFGGSAGMTNTGTLSLVNGDIGTISTGTSTVTGFHDTSGDVYTETTANIGPVNGTIFTCTNSTMGPTSASPDPAKCAIATQARLDAGIAYLALAAMPGGPDPGAGNLANLTLLPGVYTASSGSFKIEGGDLTLDAQGNANAVWVFQMASTLTVGGPGAAFPQGIILANGALAKNVFWQVGTFATINAAGGGTMVGNIISQAGASFSTVGNTTITTLNGRALSLGASVTLVDTIINVPAP